MGLGRARGAGAPDRPPQAVNRTLACCSRSLPSQPSQPSGSTCTARQVAQLAASELGAQRIATGAQNGCVQPTSRSAASQLAGPPLRPSLAPRSGAALSRAERSAQACRWPPGS